MLLCWSEPCDPLQQNYLVIKNDQQYYLVPIQDSCVVKNEGKSEIVEPPCPSPKIKVEVADESTEEPEEIYKDVKDELNLASEIHNENLKYTCPYCWLKFDKNCNLRDHVMVHSNVYPHECSICGIRLETKTLLTSHVLLHESSMELFHCADCDFKSTKASSVTCHQVKWHADVYKCQFCFELFQNKVVFLQHMELHNAVTVCDVCNQVCEDNCHLTQHKRKHQNDKSYIHTQLYKQLQREDERQNDEKKQANIKKCKLQKFDLQERFNRLNWNLSLPTEKKFFKCSQCKWSFRTMSLLNKHTKRHSRNFKCNECDAVFKYKASFLKHKYKHEAGDDDEDEYEDEDEDEDEY
ncbi:uncharacterized protein LOC143900402 [Temnothorax americanus]|uniref:uncharacterized protein LOC143900402 n=1 Tax=Temnothorax americanus TaxID=1964332 RepID=UPI004068053F